MNPPTDFTRIVNRTRYSTATATLLAGNDFWDGHNWERSGRNTFLYCTPNGRYFTVSLSQWQGESDDLLPIDIDEAIELFEGPLTEHRVDYEDAFPAVEIVEG